MGKSRRQIQLFVLNVLIASRLVPVRIRWRLLKLMGMRLEPCAIAPGTYFGGIDITIGENSGCNIGCVFDNLGSITIGRGVAVGHQVLFLTSTHAQGSNGRAWGAAAGRPIVVGDGAWIGARATIMPGVTIGAGCTIGAGAVVTRDCAPGGVYAGVPARLIRAAEAQAGAVPSPRAEQPAVVTA